MEVKDALHLLEDYNLWLVVIGLAIMAATVLPRLLGDKTLSLPIILLIAGYAVIALPLGLEAPDPQQHGKVTEHLTELGVIIALMGAGLKIDRKPNFRKWAVTWRLLGITMVLSIALAAWVGWWLAAFVPASAVLLGAVIAPTDPVLASEVQVKAPQEGKGEDRQNGRGNEDEFRFALTSEAGLNDGLAFPFTNMAIAMFIAGAHPGNWFGSWLLGNVLYEMAIGILFGVGLGFLMARVLLNMPADSKLAKAMTGLGALAATLFIYGATEYAGGYGFIATFIGALAIRNYKPDHSYHKAMHILTEKMERIFTAIILIALGAAIAGGLLAPLNTSLVICALLIIFIIRPLAGMIGLIGHHTSPWQEKLAISFMGIRGIGSLFYLAYALNKEDFTGADQLWALVALVIVISTFVHGITAAPISKHLDKIRVKKDS